MKLMLRIGTTVGGHPAKPIGERSKLGVAKTVIVLAPDASCLVVGDPRAELRRTPDRRTVTRTQLWEAFAKGGNELRQECSTTGGKLLRYLNAALVVERDKHVALLPEQACRIKAGLHVRRAQRSIFPKGTLHHLAKFDDTHKRLARLESRFFNCRSLIRVAGNGTGKRHLIRKLLHDRTKCMGHQLGAGDQSCERYRVIFHRALSRDLVLVVSNDSIACRLKRDSAGRIVAVLGDLILPRRDRCDVPIANGVGPRKERGQQGPVFINVWHGLLNHTPWLAGTAKRALSWRKRAWCELDLCRERISRIGAPGRPSGVSTQARPSTSVFTIKAALFCSTDRFAREPVRRARLPVRHRLDHDP